MPLIHDNPWLVSQLIQAALDSENKLSKKGQAAPAQEQPVATGLKSILNNLRNQINPGSDSTGAISHETSGADVFSHNMDSMGDLVQWLANNGTRVGGKAIVYAGNVARPGEEYGYFKIEPGTEILVRDNPARPDRGNASLVGFWINPEALKNYLVSLQEDEKLKTNVMLQVQLLKLIQDANKQLDLDVSEQYKAPEKTLPDTQVLDTVVKDMDPQQWFNPGNVPLTIGDLKDATTFNAWLSKNSISIKVGERRMMINHPEFDRCAILKILNQRVKYTSDRAQTAEAKQVAVVYGQKIKALAVEVQCDLGAQPQQPGQEKPGDQGGGLAAASPQILQKLSSLRPFNAQYISFPEIKKFVDLYATYANDPTVTQLAGNINQYMDTAKNQYFGTDTLQINNIDNSRFKALLKNPSTGGGSAAMPACNLLYDVVVYAGQLYQRLVFSLQTVAQDPERGKYIDYRSMQQQITPGGPQQTNVTTLHDLSESLMREWMARR